MCRYDSALKQHALMGHGVALSRSIEMCTYVPLLYRYKHVEYSTDTHARTHACMHMYMSIVNLYYCILVVVPCWVIFMLSCCLLAQPDVKDLTQQQQVYIESGEEHDICLVCAVYAARTADTSDTNFSVSVISAVLAAYPSRARQRGFMQAFVRREARQLTRTVHLKLAG